MFAGKAMVVSPVQSPSTLTAEISDNKDVLIPVHDFTCSELSQKTMSGTVYEQQARGFNCRTLDTCNESIRSRLFLLLHIICFQGWTCVVFTRSIIVTIVDHTLSVIEAPKTSILL